MVKFKTVINKLPFFRNKKNKTFPFKGEILRIEYENIELKKIVTFIVNNKIEDAIAYYSTIYQACCNDFVNSNLCQIIKKKEVVNKLSSFKDRYFEFFLSFLNCNNNVLENAFYKNHKIFILEVQQRLLFKEKHSQDFFSNRIDEWKEIFQIENVPYLTKPMLHKEIERFNVNNDTELFKGLIKLTPLYFLRKMQMANFVEFIDLKNTLSYFKDYKKLRILDYGCGSADLSLYCAMIGHDVTICDIKDGNLDAAQKRFYLRKLPVKTIGVTYKAPIPKIDDNFDLIIALEVIEHVRKPHKLLKLFDNSLNSNGIIMLGSFPFKRTSATGDHLIEAVSQKKSLLNYINSKWSKFEQKSTVNIFIKR